MPLVEVVQQLCNTIVVILAYKMFFFFYKQWWFEGCYLTNNRYFCIICRSAALTVIWLNVFNLKYQICPTILTDLFTFHTKQKHGLALQRKINKINTQLHMGQKATTSHVRKINNANQNILKSKRTWLYSLLWPTSWTKVYISITRKQNELKTQILTFKRLSAELFLHLKV